MTGQSNSRVTCGLTVDGDVYCWGRNDRYNFGYPFPSSCTATDICMASKPTQKVQLPLPAVDISTADRATCAALTDDSVWCWGRDDYNGAGQGGEVNSGNPALYHVITPRQVPLHNALNKP